ncbi:MAG: efflux transporter outer membrane subunit, partial [Alphaproteobacteria bacterium]|nr:efflux transporter outer membrane subunit [Alphaproteobacteria bacterium]
MPETYRGVAALEAMKAEQKKGADKTKSTTNAAMPAAVPTTILPHPVSSWWREFGSDELNNLVERALANNHDLKAAVSRIAQAEAQAGVAAGSLLPLLQTSASNQTLKGGLGTAASTPNGNAERLHEFALNASYELDFWGKNRWTEEAALAAAQVNVYNRETIALTLVADVVTNYLQYLIASERVAVGQHNVDNMTTVLEVVTRRKRIGEGTDVEIQQQYTALYQAQATLSPLTLAREQTLDRLAALVGETPETLHLTAVTTQGLTLPAVPDILPSQLLATRPDIRRAEASIAAADANIGVARAMLLPSFTLSGATGYGSFYLTTLMSPASFYYQVSANMAGTLFDNGKTRSQIAFSKAFYNEQVETYRQAILNAVRDVDDALASIRYSADEERAQLSAWASAQEAYRLSQLAFHIGTTDYLTILETERTLYQTEDAKVQARLDRFNAAAALFRSLGGAVDPAVDKPKDK